MSLTSNFDKLNKLNEERKSSPKEEPKRGTIRNICFILPDYTQIFLKYDYLVSGSLSPDGVIVLYFTTHTVTLNGYNLERLFQFIIDHEIAVIPCENPRHEETFNKKSDSFVIDIKISKA